MGMMIGGFGNIGNIGSISSFGSRSANRQVVTLKNADGSVAGRITKTAGSNSSKKPRKLLYNFKQISARILQAKTSGNAGQTVIMARAKLAELRQKVKGGEFDDAELAAAILHSCRWQNRCSFSSFYLAGELSKFL